MSRWLQLVEGALEPLFEAEAAVQMACKHVPPDVGVAMPCPRVLDWSGAGAGVPASRSLKGSLPRGTLLRCPIHVLAPVVVVLEAGLKEAQEEDERWYKILEAM